MTTFIVRTVLGVPICTSSDERVARRRALQKRAQFPGCYLESETRIVTGNTVSFVVRRLWTDRSADKRAA